MVQFKQLRKLSVNNRKHLKVVIVQYIKIFKAFQFIDASYPIRLVVCVRIPTDHCSNECIREKSSPGFINKFCR